jgi:hypothetical protein
MQSTENKSKRSRSSAEESNAAIQQAPAAGAEEITKTRRKASAKKGSAEASPAAKQHRGSAKKSVISVPAPVEISHDDIASLAYSYWTERGYQGGSAEEDWFRALKQLSPRQ